MDIKDKSKLYHMERFEQSKLLKLNSDIQDYALAVGGLPKHHSEVFQKRGWLVPFLFGYDDLLWGRWEYWTQILQKGTIEGSVSIPQIRWAELSSNGVSGTKKMLSDCMNHNEATVDNFAEWLLWGLAGVGEKETPKISEKLNEHYYRTFDLFLIIDNPTDYLSYVLCDQTGKGYKSGLGYYPTPFSICEMMVKMSHGSEDPEEMKKKTVYEPCLGCGAMLLPASNYFLRGFGQDISAIAIKLSKIQFYFYAPWYALPGNVIGFDSNNKIEINHELENNNGQLTLLFA